ncbi:MAG: hypothetical protein KY475_12295, partial [Planctomycetes bacterium]|nr:hypothetical protein [Planctomycetota bacterium]
RKADVEIIRLAAVVTPTATPTRAVPQRVAAAAANSSLPQFILRKHGRRSRPVNNVVEAPVRSLSLKEALARLAEDPASRN